MAIKIGSNIASLQAQRRLADASSARAKSLERLSSGLRINSASDDPAAHAIAASLRADTRVLTQAIRNINDGVSAVSIANSAIDSLKGLLVRQRELATQAASGIYSSTQRSAINTEAQALVSEYNRIIESTKFNGQNLLDGSVSQINIQAGTTSQSSSRITIEAADISSPVVQVSGDGTFQTPTTAASGGGGGGIWNTYLVDVNGDGKLDIVNAGGSGGLGVALGNGNGTFAAANNVVPAASYVSTVTFGDLNGDGKVDVVTGSANDNSVTIWLGAGDGTFSVSTSLAGAGTRIRSTALVDINNDGKLDIVAGDQFGAATGVWLGQGNGTFGARTDAGSQEVYSMASADINGDGNKDIIMAGATGLMTMLGNGNGTFQSAITQTALGGTAFNVQALDINNDNKIDIVTTDYSGKVLMLLGNGNGTFNSPLSVAVAGGPTDVEAADLNGDGNIDLAVAAEDSNTITIFTGDGTGAFTKISTTVMPGSTGVYETDTVAIGDVNGDGGLDLVAGQDLHNVNYLLLANVHSASHDLNYNLLSQTAAGLAITQIDLAQQTLASAQGKLGAAESRLNVASSLSSSRVGEQTAALSRIQDVDVALETAQLLRTSILQEIATAMISHSVSDSKLVLSLLKD